MRYAICALVLLASCGGSTEPSNRLAGDYSLQSIDGHALPTVIGAGSASFTVSAGSLKLTADGQYSELITSRSGAFLDTLADAAGTWSGGNDALVFVLPSRRVTEYTGSFSNGQLSLSDGHSAYIFVK